MVYGPVSIPTAIIELRCCRRLFYLASEVGRELGAMHESKGDLFYPKRTKDFPTVVADPNLNPET